MTMSVFAAGNTISANIYSQPSSVASNRDYTISFYVNDTTNQTANVTAWFYVNDVNVVNATWTNNVTVPNGSNAYSATFASGYYVLNDKLYTNITMVEAGNTSVTNNSRSNTIYATDSTTSIIASDTFSGLPALGTNLGGFMRNLAPGIVAIIFVLGIIGGICMIFYATSDSIRNSVQTAMRRK